MLDDDDPFEPAEPVPATTLGPTFEAEYRSDCSEGDEIEPGETIRADGHGGYVHASCARLASRPVIWE